MSITKYDVFDAVRRGYNDLDSASEFEILDYFDNVNPDKMIGHISNIKGIVFEQEIVSALNEQGVNAVIFEATNHPISDISIMTDGDISAEVQLKATDSSSYINETLEAHEIPIIATSEVAKNIENSLVIDSGLDNELLTHIVRDTLINDFTTEYSSELGSELVSENLGEVIRESLLPFPISPIGLIAALVGLPLL